MTLDIPEDTTLTVPEGRTLTNNGTINRTGTIERLGTIICNSHNGGTATCTEQAVCDICEAAYGDLDPNNHSGEAVWTTTEKTHTQTWNCCNAVAVAEEAHEWENGVCKECTYACQHSGGTATCKGKAVCEICGESYGELDAKNHSALKHVDAKAATKDAEGNKEYWYCSDCGKYFSDQNASKEIAKADTVIAKTAANSSNKSDKSDKGNNASTVRTGDTASLALWIVLLLSSGGAAIIALTRGKKDNF